MLCSNNSSSNLLIQGTDTAVDAKSMMRDGLNESPVRCRRLGAVHTYINAPHYVADRSDEMKISTTVCQSPTPANTTYNTNPTPTPRRPPMIWAFC